MGAAQQLQALPAELLVNGPIVQEERGQRANERVHAPLVRGRVRRLRGRRPPAAVGDVVQHAEMLRERAGRVPRRQTAARSDQVAHAGLGLVGTDRRKGRQHEEGRDRMKGDLAVVVDDVPEQGKQLVGDHGVAVEQRRAGLCGDRLIAFALGHGGELPQGLAPPRPGVPDAKRQEHAGRQQHGAAENAGAGDHARQGGGRLAGDQRPCRHFRKEIETRTRCQGRQLAQQHRHHQLRVGIPVVHAGDLVVHQHEPDVVDPLLEQRLVNEADGFEPSP